MALRGRLEPRGIGDIVDVALQVYRANFAAFFGVVFLTNLSVWALSHLIGLWLGRLSPVEVAAKGLSADLLQIAGVLGFGLLLHAVGYRYVEAVLTLGVSRFYLGHPMGPAAMLKRGAGRLLTLFLAVAASIGVVGVLGLLTSIPFAVLVVILQRLGRGTSVWAPVAVVGVLSSFAVCLAFALRFFLISEAVMLEDCGAIEALKRSKQLMVDHSPKGLLAVESHSLRLSAILLLVLALGLLAYVVSRLPFAVIAVAGMLARGGDIGSLIDAPSVFPPAAEFAGVVASSLVQPVGISAIVLFYYDLRIRTEGFDLDVLAHEITSKSG